MSLIFNHIIRKIDKTKINRLVMLLFTKILTKLCLPFRILNDSLLVDYLISLVQYFLGER